VRRTWFPAIVVFALVAVACTGGGGGGESPGGNGTPGVVHIILWQGYGAPTQPGETPNREADSMHALVDEFNKTYPNISVEIINYNNDNALAKLTVALQAGEPPDITYQYGSSMPQLAAAPGIVDLTQRVQESGFDWNDFYPGEREAATVNGRVLGIPALVDNLAIVYNKDLFDKAGLSYPTPDWTWDDFRAAAKALTDPSTKTFGFAFPADASEDSVWHFDAMLWEGGGDILNADDTKAAFDSQAGVTALQTLSDMAVTDKSVYMDFQNANSAPLFNSGKIGMMVTGPWDLPSFPDVKYGVQIMPTFPDGNHQTIAGPDNWVLFDNGAARLAAAWTFVSWLTAPAQVLTDSLVTGHLPIRQSVTQMPRFGRFATKFPGVDVFVANLANVQKARPVLKAYPRISEAMGQAIIAAMTGGKTPQQALSEAAQQVDGILAIPG
jgi:multiple sugar transport system substrate-binding protein